MKTALYSVMFLFWSWAMQGQSAGLRLPERKVPYPFTSSLNFWKPLQSTPEMQPSKPSLVLPPTHLAFFCQLELRLEHHTRIPVKFRLGTLDYVDSLEGKR